MKKPDLDINSGIVTSLLNQLLEITKAAKKSVDENDIECLTKNVKLRNVIFIELKNICDSYKLNQDEFELIKLLDEDSLNLIESVKQIKDKVSLDLISLYDARQVVKYY